MQRQWWQLLYFSLLVSSLIGSISCQSLNDLDVDDIEKKLQDNISGLENFNRSSLPTEEDLERVLKEKCEKNGGGEEAFNALKNQQVEIKNCLESQVNLTQLQSELDVAKKTGSMDEVFGKYCKKYPEVRLCLQNVTEQVKPCMDEQEKQTMEQVIKLVEELQEFLCFKDGDRMAMFIAEGGIECIESKKDKIQECANETLGSRIPTDLSVNNLPAFIFTERECNDFDEIRKCVNSHLEKCKDSTPANIVDAFFKFLRNHIPCDKKGVQSAPVVDGEPSSASRIMNFMAVLLMPVSIILLKYV